jgi:hypothetical protein
MRAWKGMPRAALDRLHEGALILHPKSSSAKAVVLSARKVAEAAEGAFRRRSLNVEPLRPDPKPCQNGS